MEKLVSGCPVLEDLTLINYFVNYHLEDVSLLLRVSSQTLKRFCITFLRHMSGTDFSVQIDAPRLECMSFKENQSDSIVVKNLSSLLMIDVDTTFNVKHGSTLKPEDLTKKEMICDFLTGISSVRQMLISQRTFEVLYHYSKQLGPIPKFYNLYRLQAAFSSSMLELLVTNSNMEKLRLSIYTLLPVFLDSCPNLKNLVLDLAVSTEPEQIELSYVPQCLLWTLECVEIKKVFMEEEIGKKLVRYFFENSAVLLKLILSFKDSPKTNEDSDIFKELSKIIIH